MGRSPRRLRRRLARARWARALGGKAAGLRPFPGPARSFPKQPSPWHKKHRHSQAVLQCGYYR